MRRDRSSGQALVEFVLVAPLLFLMVLGIISYGLYINANLTVEQAARVGTRAAAIGDRPGCPGDSAAAEQSQNLPITIYGVVDDQINNGFGLSAGHQTLLTPAPTETQNQSNPSESIVTVSVSLPYRPILPIPGLLPSQVTLTQVDTMMVQVAQPTNSNGTLVQQCP